MKRWPLILALLAIMVVAALPADAVGPNCLPSPLPSEPPAGAATFSVRIQDITHQTTLTIWRHPCQDSADVVLLMRATPATNPFLLCSLDFHLVQDTVLFDASLQQAITAPPFCGGVPVPATFVFGVPPCGDVTFDETQPFSLLFKGSLLGPNVFVPPGRSGG